MLRAGHIVFLCALALLTLGVVMVSSAGMEVKAVHVPPGTSAAQAVAGPQNLFDAVAGLVLSKNGFYMALAILAMASMAMMPLDRFVTQSSAINRPRHRAALFTLVGGVIILTGLVATSYMPGLKHPVNHSLRWVAIPGFKSLTIQPSEFAKWGMLVVLAAYGAWRADLMKSFSKGLVPALIAIGIVAAAIAHQDLGTGVLVFAAGGLVLIAAGARIWHFLVFIPPAAVGVVALIIANPYRVKRIETFFDPYLQPQKAGYHMIQSMLAVSGGQGTGRGLGFGLQKFGYLPEDTTDFLFAIICEELGIFGALMVAGLYTALLWAGLSIVRRQTSPMLKLLGLGVLSTIGLQALINLAVVTGIGPTKGIALPLLSSGGTGWILTAASLGLLIAMDTELAAEPVEAAEPQLAVADSMIEAGAPQPVAT